MLTIHFEGIQPLPCHQLKLIQDHGLTLNDLHTLAENSFSLSRDDIYFVRNGKKLADDTQVSNGIVRAIPRLRGGKGGFGSMLRAIGAQIEKTTNREACRDLSGRRLRDINEEKRLKNWISKKADREREALERKKKKLEKLRSEPKIEFSDKQYEEERTKLTEVVHDAVEKGFEASTSKPGTSNTTKKSATKKAFMFEEDISDVSSVSTSDEDSEDDRVPKHQANSDSDEDSEDGDGMLKHTDSDSGEDSESVDMVTKRKADSDSEEATPNKRQFISVRDTDCQPSNESYEDSSLKVTTKNIQNYHCKGSS